MSDQDGEKPIKNRWKANAASRAKLLANLEAMGALVPSKLDLKPGEVVIILPLFSESAPARQKDAPVSSATQQPPTEPVEGPVT